jgi:cytochrome c-type biogenesis protein CcmH
MRRAAGLTLVLLALLAPAALGAVQRASMADVESQLMCVTCGIPLELAVSPQADSERAEVQQLIDEGLTATQIKRAMVAQLGPNVLALPPHKGFDLAVYVVPVIVIALLLALLSVGLRRLRRREPTDDGAVGGPELGMIEAGRLDEDLARFDA